MPLSSFCASGWVPGSRVWPFPTGRCRCASWATQSCPYIGNESGSMHTRAPWYNSRFHRHGNGLRRADHLRTSAWVCSCLGQWETASLRRKIPSTVSRSTSPEDPPTAIQSSQRPTYRENDIVRGVRKNINMPDHQDVSTCTFCDALNAHRAFSFSMGKNGAFLMWDLFVSESCSHIIWAVLSYYVNGGPLFACVCISAGFALRGHLLLNERLSLR